MEESVCGVEVVIRHDILCSNHTAHSNSTTDTHACAWTDPYTYTRPYTYTHACAVGKIDIEHIIRISGIHYIGDGAGFSYV